MMRLLTVIAVLSGMFLMTACGKQADISMGSNEILSTADADITALKTRLEDLQASAQRIKDSNDIKRLQRIYGYYLDEALWEELVNLFSEDATVEYAREGVYMGKERIREYLYKLGGDQQGLREGQLNEHFQLMPVITLSEDGMSAKGRWRALILTGEYGEDAVWGEGPYENEYAKEDGVWKISKVKWYQTIMVPYEGAWGLNEDINKGIFVSPEFPPDQPQTDSYGSWPETFLPPFHFDNPIGRYVPSAETRGKG